MNEKPTDEQVKQIEDTEISYRKAKNFFHCKNCIEQFLGSPLHEVMTPKEYGLYEVSSYEFTYPDSTKEEITVVWCKRCSRRIWDSRNMKKLY